jgi:hypothetical protein
MNNLAVSKKLLPRSWLSQSESLAQRRRATSNKLALKNLANPSL